MPLSRASLGYRNACRQDLDRWNESNDVDSGQCTPLIETPYKGPGLTTGIVFVYSPAMNDAFAGRFFVSLFSCQRDLA